MLAVTLNQLRFEYDIHSLVKAFYPAETVKVFRRARRIWSPMGTTRRSR